MRRLFFILSAVMLTVGMMAQPPRHHESERGHGHGHSHATHQVFCATPEQLSMTLQVVGQQSFDVILPCAMCSRSNLTTTNSSAPSIPQEGNSSSSVTARPTTSWELR